MFCNQLLNQEIDFFLANQKRCPNVFANHCLENGGFVNSITFFLIQPPLAE
jgi:hypothetical protein